MNDNYRAELIQVAAVAVAIVEDLDSASGADLNRTQSILKEIHEERFRQNEKWGPQHHTAIAWLAILMEEVGEVAEEIDVEYLDEARFKMWVVQAGQSARAFLGKMFP